MTHDSRIYSSDDGGELLVWDKRRAMSKSEKVEDGDFILRRVDHGEERGAIDCINVIGTKLYLSYDDYGNIAIKDYW